MDIETKSTTSVRLRKTEGITVESSTLAEAVEHDLYAGYAYAYPHKTSYRKLDPPISLENAWTGEDKARLFLYVHLPFCEMRCGFCNLFTASQPPEALVKQTIEAIARQSQAVARRVNPKQIVQIAIGGGTPTYLNEQELEQILVMLRNDWPISSDSPPFSVEVSPATITPAKLRLLLDHGARRISMGVQSFVERDLSNLGRPQDNVVVAEAIEKIRAANVPLFNLDLIYGSQHQHEADWIKTVEHALTYHPEEIFLYPLYVRSLTGLARTGRTPAENRRHLYMLARERLLAAGYNPISMRMFRHHSVSYNTQHCCQEDGMIGLGPGARSYTRALHYSSDYAVSGPRVRQIIDHFCQKTNADFSVADYGFQLDQEEQSRRFLIRSLLQIDGICRSDFLRNFGKDVLVQFPQISELLDCGFAVADPLTIKLTPDGIAHSDVIGPWLYSPAVKAEMEAYQLR